MSKYVLMCCGGFPTVKENKPVLCDWPDELQETDFFSSQKKAEEKVKELRSFRYFKYEDFDIMKIHDYEALMNSYETGDLSCLESVKTCVGG